MTHTWDPERYLTYADERGRPFVDLISRVGADAPARVVDLGCGAGNLTALLAARWPGATVTGLDSSPEMVFRARRLGIEVRLARMEDPLPDGPWDLVIAVLSVHHLRGEQKRDLFRRVREQARALVLADVVAADRHVAPIDAEHDFPERPSDLAEWTGGEVVWAEDDVAVITATY